MNILKTSSKFWNSSKNSEFIQDLSHWNGKGRFANKSIWEKLGKKHKKLFTTLCEITHTNLPVKNILGWGCGGGLNVLALNKLTLNYYGVDISKPNLQECSRQIKKNKIKNFYPVLIQIEKPEEVCKLIPAPIDFFISTSVYQHFPNKTYGITVTKIAYKLLSKTGIALIHIRYNNSNFELNYSGKDYTKNAIIFTSYGLEEFYKICTTTGFKVLKIIKIPLTLSAYFLLKK